MRDLHDCGQCKFTDGSEVSMRVCSECFDKTSWEPKTSDVQTRINLNPCPLPRIGSKEWVWESCSTISIYGVSRPTHRSKLTRYSVYEGVNYCVVIDPDRHDGSRRIGSELSLRDAKTLAEARARRDWRKEQGL